MEVIDTLARDGRVEKIVRSICGRPTLSADLRDLCQLVYLVLLEYRGDLIVDLWEHGEINFFIGRIVLNQYRSRHSRYFNEIVKWQERFKDIDKYKEKEDHDRDRQ